MKSVGIDGCRSGWFSVSSDMETLRFDSISELIKHYGENCLYYIDIPIGLVSELSSERSCETLMRSILTGHRKSSVFGVPSRQALEAKNFENANEANRKILGKGVSKQSFFIFDKIREVDIFLRNKQSHNLKIYESHPEIAFHFLNGEKSMMFNKKTNQGLEERLRILEFYDSRVRETFHRSLKMYLRKDVAKDDIVDAMCLAIMGSNLPNRTIETLPKNKELDIYKIEMGIHYSIAINSL